MNVFLVAYSCEPGFSSEREVGWRWAKLLAANVGLTVITRTSNRNAIEEHSLEGVNWIYIDLPKCFRFWKSKERGLYLYYTIWQFLAAIVINIKIWRGTKVDVLHYITFGTLLLPHFLFMVRKPLIIGPAGGFERMDIRFIDNNTITTRFKFLLRRCLQNVQRYSLLWHLGFITTKHIYVRTHETYNYLPQYLRKKSSLMLETGFDLPIFGSESINLSGFNVIFVGRLIEGKIGRFTIDVWKEFEQRFTNVTFHIVGDGPLRKDLEEYTERNNIESIIFHGWQKQNGVHTLLSSCDVYLTTTLKEGGSWALFEAAAHSLPVVCLKVNGPDVIVGEQSGIKVPIYNKDKSEVKVDLVNALVNLRENANNAERLGKVNFSTVKDNFSWTSMVNDVLEKYAGV